ncbi:MAG: hypothetical protein ABS79_04385 [Planctomycetes bacterium SCN 63-9]|nr:MAG: hypothetical protein ABS79_04385 [Planctomycetes bacterium SCN 63-9]
MSTTYATDKIEPSHALSELAAQFGIQPSTAQGVNVGDLERWASVAGGGALIAYALSKLSLGGIAAGVLGGALVYRALSGHCDAYEALGINTNCGEESCPRE